MYSEYALSANCQQPEIVQEVCEDYEYSCTYGTYSEVYVLWVMSCCVADVTVWPW